MRYFGEEYRAHIEGPGCAAGVCVGAGSKSKEVSE
jgi:hypothetical protein